MRRCAGPGDDPRPELEMLLRQARLAEQARLFKVVSTVVGCWWLVISFGGWLWLVPGLDSGIFFR